VAFHYSLRKNTDSFPDLSNKTFHKSVLCIYISSCMFLLYLYLSSSQNALPLSSSHLLFFIHTKLILILDILYLLFPLPVPELYGSSSCSSDLGLNVFSQSDHPCSTNLTRATMSQVMYFLKFFVLHWSYLIISYLYLDCLIYYYLALQGLK